MIYGKRALWSIVYFKDAVVVTMGVGEFRILTQKVKKYFKLYKK